MSIDFASVNAHLIARAQQFLADMFPAGKVKGREFCIGDIRGEPGESLKINLVTGIGADFASGETYGDLIAVYAAHHGLGMGDAAKQLSNGAGEPYRAPPAIYRPPAGAIAPDCIHYKYGAPASVYEYRDQSGLIHCVARYQVDGGKEIIPWSWDGQRWQAKGYPKPRPLYGLEKLQASTLSTVIVVEGEKCVDALRAMGINRIPVSASGGTSGFRHADWSALSGRDVLLFPDHDAPGRKCMAELADRLIGVAGKIRVIDHASLDLPTGWDVADTQWSADELNIWAKPLIKSVEQTRVAQSLNPVSLPEVIAEVPRETTEQYEPAAPPAKLKRGKPRTKTNGQPQTGTQIEQPASTSPFVSWESLSLDCDHRGNPYPNIANVKKLLLAHPEVMQRIWYDDFHHRTFSKLFSDSPKEWVDHNDTDLCAWIQTSLRIPKIGIDIIKRAVESVARTQAKHELREWLATLKWDGTPRLATLLSDAYGAVQNDYTAAVGRCWITSMIARAMIPGCQVDTIIVLEGAQGIRKSSSLAVLGGKWYASLPEAFGTRDFLMAIDGVWLAEIPDMSSFKGRDIQHVKAIITTRSDRYRRSYAYHAETYPRQCVLAATANGSDWNQDPSGARRFWPVACKAVNIEYLVGAREQLFAEALALFSSGASWWDVPETEARDEQEKRREIDAWEEILQPWVAYVGRDIITSSEVFDGPIPVPAERRDMRLTKRLASVLRTLGYERGKRRYLGKITNCFFRTGYKGYDVEQNTLL